MTHSQFDYSAKSLGEIGPWSAQLQRMETVCCFPTQGARAAEGVIYSMAFHLDCSLNTLAQDIALTRASHH